VYGLKPSYGRVPMYPSCRDTRYPGFSGWETLEHVGPLTRTVADAALVMDVIAGPDARDRHSLPSAAYSYSDIVTSDEPDVRGLRVAWTADWGGWASADPAVQEAVQAVAGTFESLGASVEQADPGIDNPVTILGPQVALDGDVPAMREMIAAHPGQIDERVVMIFERELSYLELSDAMARRRDLWDRMWRFFEKYDLLLTPTVPVAPFAVGLEAPDEIDGQPVTDPRQIIGFTFPFNLTGTPAATVPAAWTDGSLPIGVQLAAGHLRDDVLLRASRAFELATPWADRKPEL
jgi:aspartyl-tRNA(Asn)/glutamyl-tRNA(Gln) amidotransferase subunit A